MRVLVLLAGRAYQKTAPILEHTSCDYKVELIGQADDNVGANSLNSLRLPVKVMRFAKSYFQHRVRQVINEYQPDVIFTNPGIVRRLDTGSIWRNGIPIVVRLGGHIYAEAKENLNGTGLLNYLVRRTGYELAFRRLRQATRVVVVSRDMAEQLVMNDSRSPQDISVVPVPCDMERFNLPKDEDGRILVVTHLNFRKKVQAFHDFMPALNQFNNVRIIAPGRYRDMVQPFTQHLIAPYVANIEREYQRASVFCYFSYLDGCPNVILEAWASRTPVVANKWGWSDELIKDGETGLLVQDATEAQEAIGRLLVDAKLRKRLSDNGYEYVRNHHSMPIVARRLQEALEAAITQTTARGRSGILENTTKEVGQSERN